MSDEIKIDAAAAASGGPGWLTVGCRTLVVRHPTPADFFALNDYARGLAAAEVRTPMQAIAADLQHVPAEFRGEFIREAVAQSAGAKAPEPTRDAISHKAQSHDGVTWFAWWLAKENHPDLTHEAVRALSPEPELHALSAALMAAIKLADTHDPKDSASSPPG